MATMPPIDDDALLKQTSASSGGGGYESKYESAAAARTSDTHHSGVVTDIQKKMKRAERFGMPVRMTEEEKRNSRAESFEIMNNHLPVVEHTLIVHNTLRNLKPSLRQLRASSIGTYVSDHRTALVALRNCLYLLPLGYLAYD
ncbi:hypothetical protein OROHE_005027 [Orobanche hederae]